MFPFLPAHPQEKRRSSQIPLPSERGNSQTETPKPIEASITCPCLISSREEQKRIYQDIFFLPLPLRESPAKFRPLKKITLISVLVRPFLPENILCCVKAVGASEQSRPAWQINPLLSAGDERTKKQRRNSVGHSQRCWSPRDKTSRVNKSAKKWKKLNDFAIRPSSLPFLMSQNSALWKRRSG